MNKVITSKNQTPLSGPPVMDGLGHVSVPCRNLEEGIRFYRDVLGGKIVVEEPAFAMFDLWGTHIGIGSDGCTFIEASKEYPHIGIDCSADSLLKMKEWLAACGVPSSNLWTRAGIEAMMFFRDPSGNVIELYCPEGYADAPNLPKGPAKGHGNTVDIDSISYEEWHLPEE